MQKVTGCVSASDEVKLEQTCDDYKEKESSCKVFVHKTLAVEMFHVEVAKSRPSPVQQ